jgi:hypothetical protein
MAVAVAVEVVAVVVAVRWDGNEMGWEREWAGNGSGLGWE